MIRKATNNKNTAIALTIILISLVTIAFLQNDSFLQPNSMMGRAAATDQSQKQSSLSTNITDNDEPQMQDDVRLYSNFSSTALITTSTSPESRNSAIDLQLNQKQLSFPNVDNIQVQLAGLDNASSTGVTNINESENLDASNLNNNNSSVSATTAVKLDDLNFIAYSYGGYSVEQTDQNQLFFSYPNITNQGQLSGSDALALNSYLIQKLDFDAVFIAPKINANGFDEMVVFAASDTTTYKGTEFGIRLGLIDGFIYGYIQEPNGNYEDVNFHMLQMAPNDGKIHHYTLIMLGTEVEFYIDGLDYGHLGFPSQTDYSSLTFWVLAVVHRFTDGWDSLGDNMVVENFSVTQQ